MTLDEEIEKLASYDPLDEEIEKLASYDPLEEVLVARSQGSRYVWNIDVGDMSVGSAKKFIKLFEKIIITQ